MFDKKSFFSWLAAVAAGAAVAALGHLAAGLEGVASAGFISDPTLASVAGVVATVVIRFINALVGKLGGGAA